MMTEQLLNELSEFHRSLDPCPFCGNRAAVFRGIYGNDNYFSAVCSNCNCVFGDFETLPELLRAYNKRFSYPLSTVVSHLLSDDKKVDNLLNSLSTVAASVNFSEYGLPLIDKGEKELLRKVVLKWIATL